MKKLFFGLVAMVVFGNISFGQKKQTVDLNDLTSPPTTVVVDKQGKKIILNNEQAEVVDYLKTMMVDYVDLLRPFYKKGQSYEQFKNATYGKNGIPSKVAEKITYESYVFISKNQDSRAIKLSYNGKSMAELVSLLDKSDKNSFENHVTKTFGNDIVKLHESNYGKDTIVGGGFWGFIKDVGNWLWDNREEIQKVITFLLTIF
jgi:hypothetical protein